jgi:hypothetical protein
MVRYLDMRNPLSRQDEVLSLTPNDSLFFIVQIVNNSTNQINNLAIGLQSFLARDYNNREDARRDV